MSSWRSRSTPPTSPHRQRCWSTLSSWAFRSRSTCTSPRRGWGRLCRSRGSRVRGRMGVCSFWTWRRGRGRRIIPVMTTTKSCMWRRSRSMRGRDWRSRYRSRGSGRGRWKRNRQRKRRRIWIWGGLRTRWTRGWRSRRSWGRWRRSVRSR